MINEKCTYCGKKLGSMYGFSYGIPGITRVYECDRKLCKTTIRIKRKVNPHLRKFIKQMYSIVSDV